MRHVSVQTGVQQDEQLALLRGEVLRELDVVISGTAGSVALTRAIQFLDRSVPEVGQTEFRLGYDMTWTFLIEAIPMAHAGG